MYWKKERIVNTLSYLPAAQYPNISRQQLKTLSVKDASRKSLDFNNEVQNFKQQRLAYKLDKQPQKLEIVIMIFLTNFQTHSTRSP